MTHQMGLNHPQIYVNVDAFVLIFLECNRESRRQLCAPEQSYRAHMLPNDKEKTTQAICETQSGNERTEGINENLRNSLATII